MTNIEKYLIFDEPIPYKDLVFYPVKVKDYIMFLTLASCLTLEKNSIKDPVLALKAISMSYLEYLYFVSNDENNLLLFLDALLRLVLNKTTDEFEITYNKGKNPNFVINQIQYNSLDFDEIRKIISEQNSLELPNERIQKNVREEIEKARRYKERRNKTKTASFEEQLVALTLFTGWGFEKIYDLTVRKFLMAVKRANHMIMSNIYLSASMSGFATFKDKSILKGWLADLEPEDEFADVTMSLDSIKKEVSGENAKNK